ncbi:MAG: hypothetical protein H0X51_04190 [Parachlamydiaceae bacterium]|nr:hypothetical protein [Parachlamydiaceae bacterium]
MFLSYIKRLFFAVILCLHHVYADENPSELVESGMHGLVDVVFKNDYITPRGLLVTDTGLTMQVLLGLSLEVHKSSDCFVQKVSMDMGIWNDIWTEQHHPKVGSWNELDWFLGVTATLQNNWRFQAQFIQFLSPPGNFTPENNAEFILTYDDSSWGNFLKWYPYVKLFWAISGDSTVVVGKPGGTYYVELGMTPTYEFQGYPVVVAFPTWLSMGPADFWNGGELALKSSESNFGVFSTGVKGVIPLTCVKSSLGRWYIDVGAQYYYLINRNLLQAQLFTVGVDSIDSAHRNVGVGYIGFGFTY